MSFGFILNFRVVFGDYFDTRIYEKICCFVQHFKTRSIVHYVKFILIIFVQFISIIRIQSPTIHFLTFRQLQFSILTQLRTEAIQYEELSSTNDSVSYKVLHKK